MTAADLVSTEAVPFSSAEEAWFWTMAAMLAREDGAGIGWRPEGPDRLCDPDDVVSCVNALYVQRKITLAHARVIRSYGALQMTPRLLPERDHRLWHQAMALIDWRLRGQGVIR